MTGGNPFFVGELARFTAAGGQAGLPPSVREAIAHRMDRLSPRCRHQLRAASVVGGKFSVAVTAAIIGRPVLECLDPLDEAAAAGIVEPGTRPGEVHYRSLGPPVTWRPAPYFLLPALAVGIVVAIGQAAGPDLRPGRALPRQGGRSPRRPRCRGRRPRTRPERLPCQRGRRGHAVEARVELAAVLGRRTPVTWLGPARSSPRAPPRPPHWAWRRTPRG